MPCYQRSAMLAWIYGGASLASLVMRPASLSPVTCAFTAEASSHSHATYTLQPEACSASILRLSRAVFFLNFSSQNGVLLFGVVAILHPLWRCQKQPCTNTTALWRGSTRSGFPGSRLSCNRYRSPSRWRTRRNVSSGWLSFPRIRDMRSERSEGVRKSVIAVPIARVRRPELGRGPVQKMASHGLPRRPRRRTCTDSGGSAGSSHVQISCRDPT